MEGPAQDRGVNYRTLQDLFGVAAARSAETDYSIYVSLIEVCLTSAETHAGLVSLWSRWLCSLAAFGTLQRQLH